MSKRTVTLNYPSILWIVLLIATSCKLVVYEPDVLSVTPCDTITFGACDNELVALVVSTNVETWSYTASDWVETRVSGDTLWVCATDNNSYSVARSGNIVFSAGYAPQVSVAISQSALQRPERSIRQVVYLEVNDCNPLNILEYNLVDGTPFFDAVILFAANINYDREHDVVYLNNNSNVQALLDNSEIYLQPLRRRGIKVYLGLLGNHDEAGLAQLSAWGAKQWAVEVAETCRLYSLDGVNLDDEYSKMPDVDNKWFAMPSAKAGARLAYELKMALSDRCAWDTEVSIYEYGALYDIPSLTIDGITHTPSEFVDFIVADYGGKVYPYADFTYAHCSGASIQLNQGGELSQRVAQTAVDKGYGWCMWFAFDPSGSGGTPSNREHSMAQFRVAADFFYNSEMAEPLHVYNKIGEGLYAPTPYSLY